MDDSRTNHPNLIFIEVVQPRPTRGVINRDRPDLLVGVYLKRETYENGQLTHR